MPEQSWLLNLWDAFYKRTKANFEHEVWLHPCKVIFIARSILYILLQSFLSYCYLALNHLPFVTLSTYFHIFIAFHILTCDFTSYTQSFIHFLNLKMSSARSKRCRFLSLVFILNFSTDKIACEQALVFQISSERFDGAANTREEWPGENTRSTPQTSGSACRLRKKIKNDWFHGLRLTPMVTGFKLDKL